MLDPLAKIYDDGGSLVSVAYTLFEGHPRFVTAVELWFESLSAAFRAVAANDTLIVSLGSLVPEPDETLVEIGGSAPWSECIGLGICWAWRLNNHEGGHDGVRLEFSEPGKVSRAVVELIVVASAIEVFTAVPTDAG